MNKIILLLSIFFTSFVFALSEDAKQSIEIEAESVIVDETSGFNEFSGNAEVRQGSLLMTAELIQVQTNTDGVETMKATGTVDNPAKYIQSQENQARFFFKQKTAYEICSSDWSSDVCSSDLLKL